MPAKDRSTGNSCASVCLSPDGSRAIVAVGSKVVLLIDKIKFSCEQVLLYNASNGELIESLRGHKDVVSSLDYSFDGEKFASGGESNCFIQSYLECNRSR